MRTLTAQELNATRRQRLAERAITLHQAGSRTWALPPSQPLIGEDAAVLRDGGGKVSYAPLISFATHGVRALGSRVIIAAIGEPHPGGLADDRDTAA